MLDKEYLILVVFVLLNLALPFYRRASICNVIVYISSFVFLYVAFLFYSNMRDMAIIIYFVSSLFFFYPSEYVFYICSVR